MFAPQRQKQSFDTVLSGNVTGHKTASSSCGVCPALQGSILCQHAAKYSEQLMTFHSCNCEYLKNCFNQLFVLILRERKKINYTRAYTIIYIYLSSITWLQKLDAGLGPDNGNPIFRWSGWWSRSRWRELYHRMVRTCITTTSEQRNCISTHGRDEANHIKTSSGWREECHAVSWLRTFLVPDPDFGNRYKSWSGYQDL